MCTKMHSQHIHSVNLVTNALMVPMKVIKLLVAERQRREAVELRRCLDYVSEHAHVLESVLRDSGTGSNSGEAVPLGAALVRQAGALQRCMAQCVANAARIRRLLTAAHQPQMDTMLAKMVSEACTLRYAFRNSGFNYCFVVYKRSKLLPKFPFINRQAANEGLVMLI